MKNSPIHHFYKGLHQIFNTILIVGVILQLLIFSIEINDYEIILPRFVLSKIENVLSENNLSYEADSIKLKLTGEVNAQNLNLKLNQFLEPILTCDQLTLNLSLLTLIFGRITPEEIIIRNGTLFCPPSIAPTGLNEPLIKNCFGAISIGRKYLQLQQLDFDFQDISVIAEGAWNKKASVFAPNHFSVTGKNQKTFDSIILEYLSKSKVLIEMKDKFSIFQKPVLSIHISENENEAIYLDLQLNASKCEYENHQINSLNINSKLIYSKNNINLIKPIELSAKNIILNNNIFANTLNIQTFAEFNENNLLPTIHDIKAFINNVNYKNILFDSVALNCNLSNMPSIPGHIDIVQNFNWIHAQGNIDLKTKLINGNTKGNATLNEVIPLFSQFIKQNLFKEKTEGSINWIGKINGDFNDKLNIINSDITISSQDVLFNNLHADKMYAEISFNPNTLNINYINANYGNNHIKGSIYHNLKTQDYRYLLSGSINPNLLNPYFEDWWDNLLEHFVFTTTTPFGNLDIQGNLLLTNEWFVYGELLGKNFSYNNVPIHELILRINSTQKILELIDLDLNTNYGKLEAYTKFKYGQIPNDDKIIQTYIKGNSSLALHELDSILDLHEIHDIIQNFSINNTPQISAKGSIFKEKADQTKLNILFTENAPISYYKIPFDRMDFSVDYTPKEINVQNINVEFAEGIGEATLKIRPTENNTPPEITADIQLIGVKQEIALNHLQQLWFLPNTGKANNYGGLLTLDLKATGILGDWHSFIGSGNISITQANLGRINLFGILSQILSLTPLGIGSFNLTDASTNFFIQQNIIHFPDIHIFGSTGSIEANGNFYLQNQELAFIFEISPLNKKGIPILSQMMLVFAPITQSFQMKLGGTLKNPKWETLLTPLGFGKTKGPQPPQKIDIAK